MNNIIIWFLAISFVLLVTLCTIGAIDYYFKKREEFRIVTTRELRNEIKRFDKQIRRLERARAEHKKELGRQRKVV